MKEIKLIKAKALKNFSYDFKRITKGDIFECDYDFFTQMYNIPTNDPMIDYAEIESEVNKEDKVELEVNKENKEQKITRKKK